MTRSLSCHTKSCNDNSRFWFLRRKNPEPSWVIARSIFITKRETRHVQKNWRAKEYITHDKLCERTCNFVISFWICSRRKPFCQQTSWLCALELTELCLAKSCFISLIHLSKRIWANIDKLILECLCQCMLNIGDLKIVNCTDWSDSVFAHALL